MAKPRSCGPLFWLLIAQVMLPGTAAAQDPAVDAATTVAWRTSIKVSALASRLPRAPELFVDRVGTDTLVRVRTEPTLTIGARTTVNVAYEQRVRWRSGSTGLAAAAILPSSAAAPFRVVPPLPSLSRSSNHLWEHEIDRLNVQMRLSRMDVTVGRQAIGWGRGVIFGAVDLFAPFSPLEADREWRRGVDAVHVDVKLTERSSIDGVAAVGRSWNESAVAARARGYAGSIDVEVMAGRRGRDLFGGATTSAAVGDAAIHGEVAMFATPSTAPGTGRDAVWKAVAGGSYRFPVGSGVLTYAEYHYSGFGASEPAQILSMLATPAFQDRYLRGDTQILSRHAIAVTGSYEQSADLIWSAQWVLNPADRSGVAVPGFTFTLQDDILLDANAYIPYGRPPAGAQLRSEYGVAPVAAFLQLRLYF